MFLTPLVIRAHKTPDLWVIHAPLVWQEPDGSLITVPPGFITDLASIPKALDALPWFDREGLSRLPGALHDWLYAMQVNNDKDWCDRHLRDACLAEGMSHPDAEAIYEGVHMFGQSSWDNDKGELAKVNAEGGFETKADFDAWVAAGRKLGAVKCASS